MAAQNEYSLYNRAAEAELVPTCEQLVMGLLPYHPLASGLLTGKYEYDRPAPSGSRLEHHPDRLLQADWQVIGKLQAFADARGVSLLSVAIGGLAALPAVASVITGMSNPNQVMLNAEASRWKPDAADLAELARMPGIANGSYTTYAPAPRR